MNVSQALQKVTEALHRTAKSEPFAPLFPTELEAASDAYFARGGKHLRPALCLATAHALGGDEAARRALPVALATELFHLFTLVHDDVIDHDTLRRGEACAHVLAAKLSGISEADKAAEYGVSTAILAGDALFARAVELLTRAEGLEKEARLLLIRRLTGTTLPLLLSGEALDTKLAYLDGIPDEKTLSDVYRNKTGALFAFALYAGVVCAENAPPAPEMELALTAAAHSVGEAFQLTDDYLGLTQSEVAMGKTALSDVREGKRTFFVRLAFERATKEEQALLRRVLCDKRPEKGEVLAVRDLLLHYGEDDYRARLASSHRDATAFLGLLPDDSSRALLSELFLRMLHRDR